MRITKLLRGARAVRLIKFFKGLRGIMETLVISLPSLMNVGSLLFLLFFIFAVLGIALFGKVRRRRLHRSLPVRWLSRCGSSTRVRSHARACHGRGESS